MEESAMPRRDRRNETPRAQPAKQDVAVVVDRLRKPAAAASRQDADQGTAHRIGVLEERIAHLEALLEGLQDAVHRRAVVHDEDISDVRRRIEPEEMARALSEHARQRGV
jgi:hypothetical protein